MTKEEARYLFDKGEMPYNIYAQFYANKEELFYINQKRKEEIINRIKIEKQLENEVNKKLQPILENKIDELLKGLKI